MSRALRIFVVLIFVMGFSSALSAGASAKDLGLPGVAGANGVSDVINSVTGEPTVVETTVPDSPPAVPTDAAATGADGGTGDISAPVPPTDTAGSVSESANGRGDHR